MSEFKDVDLRPGEGGRTAEITTTSEERNRAVAYIVAQSMELAEARGEVEAVKNLVLGLEGTLVAMRAFVSLAQIDKLIAFARDELGSFDSFIETQDAAAATKH